MLQMCEILNYPRSNYYYRENSTFSKTKYENIALTEVIKDIFEKSRRTYGIKRIHSELLAQGLAIGHNRIARIKQENNIYPKIKRKYKQTTDSNHNNKVAPNLLNRDFNAKKPYQKLVSDITYVSTLEGWLYLAVIIDLFNRKVVGWSMSDSLDAKIVSDSLTMAFSTNKKFESCIFHSDRGSQYTSEEIKNITQTLGLKQSMSRKGNCWDNSVAESFFKTLKYEGDIKRVFKTREEAKISIFEFIEVFYNKKRRHSAIGYFTPDEFEVEYFQNVS